MTKEEGVSTVNSDEKRNINQNKVKETERLVLLSSGLILEIRRLSLINNSEAELQWDIMEKSSNKMGWQVVLV